ncbi:MAG: carbon storage regulator CsrA [Oscillospiraceae bacterium]|jgi:carbon storage regulator|nr:carbon storage regulator CsrA [Oscillospiraceae bacterium]
MLVLTRKLNQSVSIGEDVRVTVLAIDGDRVSVGVDAPRQVRIFRSELLDGTKQTNRESTDSALLAIKELRGSSPRPTDSEK